MPSEPAAAVDTTPAASGADDNKTVLRKYAAMTGAEIHVLGSNLDASLACAELDAMIKDAEDRLAKEEKTFQELIDGFGQEYTKKKEETESAAADFTNMGVPVPQMLLDEFDVFQQGLGSKHGQAQFDKEELEAKVKEVLKIAKTVSDGNKKVRSKMEEAAAS